MRAFILLNFIICALFFSACSEDSNKKTVRPDSRILLPYAIYAYAELHDVCCRRSVVYQNIRLNAEGHLGMWQHSSTGGDLENEKNYLQWAAIYEPNGGEERKMERSLFFPVIVVNVVKLRLFLVKADGSETDISHSVNLKMRSIARYIRNNYEGAIYDTLSKPIDEFTPSDLKWISEDKGADCDFPQTNSGEKLRMEVILSDGKTVSTIVQ